MTLAIVFISVIVAFFAVITLFVVGMWHSYKEEGMLGSLVVMWVIITLFVLAVYVGGKSLKAQKAEKAGSQKELSAGVAALFLG